MLKSLMLLVLLQKGIAMELQAYSLSYLGDGRERTAVLYAPTEEAARALFSQSFRASAALISVDALTRTRRRSRVIAGIEQI